jgi:predicted dehydrogenase
MHDSITRRRFLKQSGAASLGLSLTGFLRPSARAAAQTSFRHPGPNDTLRVAVVGTNGRGQAHIDCLLGLPGVEIAYICDVDERALARGVKAVAKGQKTEPKGAKDFRKLLEDPALDAVTIATPDHWHAPMSILALTAGKHVYCEKPCSHNPYEGELLLKAVNKCGGVFQMGNQRRSFPNMQQAVKEIRDGIIGRTYFGRAWYDNRRASIGHGKPAPIPTWLDYELWQGPAPRHPFQDNLIHYNWHWFWRYGTGEALNNGTHEVDVCRWAMALDWPIRVSSNGGRYQFQDDWETPDTQVIAWDYGEGKTITWEGRSCNDYPVEGLARGTLVYGTEGAALLDGNSYTIFDNQKKKVKEVKDKPKVDPTNTVSATGVELDQLHLKNFLDSVRNGIQPNSPILEAHKSVTMLHLGNIAWRVRRELQIDPANGHIKNDADATKLWRRQYEKGWEPIV